MLPNLHSHNPPRISQRQAQKAFIILGGSGLLGCKVPLLNCVLQYETDVSEMKLQHIISTVKDPIELLPRQRHCCNVRLALLDVTEGFFIKSSCKEVKSSFKVKLCEGQMFGEAGLISCPIM